MEETITRKQILVATAATRTLLPPAFGQDTRIAALERRVAVLECQTQLSFGPSGTEVSVYGLRRAEAFYGSNFQKSDLTRTGPVGEPAFTSDSTLMGKPDFTGLETGHVTTVYAPADNLTLGLEYIRGNRTASSGATFDFDRAGASLAFSF